MIAIAAILAVHNGAGTLDRVLGHLSANDIAVHILDHGSTDTTGRIIHSHQGRSIASTSTMTFDGVFRLREQMAWKEQVFSAVSADWVLHVDADEIDESPNEGETLRRFIERMDRDGNDIIDCDEFVFAPVGHGEEHGSADFVETMRRYYHFSPQGRPLIRMARKRTGSPGWAETGGHGAILPGQRIAPERARKRHYIGLSKAHLDAQYLGRVYPGDELKRGWHRNRLPAEPDFIRLPPIDRTFDLDTDGWRTDQPEPVHLIFGSPRPFQLPTLAPSDGRRPPMPFIVGVGRSGTTLLRLMLDAHPQMVVSPETSWLDALIRQIETQTWDPDRVKALLTSAPNWGDMGISGTRLDELAARSAGADFVRGLYRLYAGRTPLKADVPRLGDKTPHNSLIMTRIAQLIPEAHFVHIIRDGRDVALSHKTLWFGPGADPASAARFWMWRITDARQQSQFLPHYLEVRYEALIANPELVLRTIGDFIQLPFDPQQLRYTEIAASRMAELGDVHWPGRVISGSLRRSAFELTAQPPDQSRVGRWRREMATADVRAFETVAGGLLADLGYAVGCGAVQPSAGS